MGNIIKISFFERVLTPLYSNYQTQTYFSIVLFIAISALLCSLLVALAYIFSLSPLQDSEKRSEYECGFEPFDNATRLPFDVHFYLVGILFLIFDVEVALFFPWVLSLRTAGWFGFYLMIAFVIILAIGFLYEWKRGALIWPSRQTELPYTTNTKKKVEATRAGYHPVVQITGGISYIDHFLINMLPEILLVVVICIVLAIIAIALGRGENKKQLGLTALQALLHGLRFVAALYAIQLFVFTESTVLFHGYALSTIYTSAIKLLTVVSCSFILSNSEAYIRINNCALLEYPIILSLATLFMLLLISSGNLVSAFISLVGFSLNLYVLILSDAPTAIAREAGVKYFYLSALSSGLMLYGIFLIFFITGTSQFFEIGQFLATNTEILISGNMLIRLGILFLLTGLFFKLSAFPGHLWAADVYEGSPDPVTAFFILPVKVAVISFILLLLVTAFQPVIIIWQPIITISALFSLIWGCFAALSEKKTKRFLAYASINQIGFILLGLATGSAEGYRATIFYLFVYAAINIVFLGIFLNTRRIDLSNLLYLTDFRQLEQTGAATISLVLSLLSIAGIPPLAGFFGKYYLLLHAQEQGLYGLVITGLFTSLISTYYYLRVIKIIWFEGTEDAGRAHTNVYKQERAVIYKAYIAITYPVLYIGLGFLVIDAIVTSLTAVGF